MWEFWSRNQFRIAPGTFLFKSFANFVANKFFINECYITLDIDLNLINGREKVCRTLLLAS